MLFSSSNVSLVAGTKTIGFRKNFVIERTGNWGEPLETSLFSRPIEPTAEPLTIVISITVHTKLGSK